MPTTRHTLHLALLLLLTGLAPAPARAQWAIPLGAGAENDAAEAVVTDGAGGVYAAGFLSGPIDFDPGPGTTLLTVPGMAINPWIARYGSDGSLRWAAAVSSDGEGIARGIGHASGRVCATGRFAGTADFDPGAATAARTAAGFADAFVACYDAAGTYQWAIALGSGGFNEGRAVAIAADGSVYVTGSFTGRVDFDPGPGTVALEARGGDAFSGDAFLAKYDAGGALLWALGFGGTALDEGRALAPDGVGGVLVTGLLQGTADLDPGAGVAEVRASGAFLARYAADGAFLWGLGLGDNANLESRSLATGPDGAVHLAGAFQQTVDFDPGPGAAVRTASGFADAYAAAYAVADGAFLGVLTVGGTELVAARGVGVGSDGSLYLGGVFGGTVDFDPGAGVAELASTGGEQGFVARYGAGGALAWAVSIESDARAEVRSVAVTGAGRTYIAGAFTGTVDFAPGAPFFGFTNAGAPGEDGFVAAYTAQGEIRVGVEPPPALAQRLGVEVFPGRVPRGGSVGVAVAQTRHVRIDLFDPLGRRVGRLYEGVLTGGGSHRLPLPPGLRGGLYLLRVADADFALTQPIVVL